MTDLDNTDPISKRSMKAELWFQKDSFKDIDEEDDEGVDLDRLAETYKDKGKYPIAITGRNREENLPILEFQ